MAEQRTRTEPTSDEQAHARTRGRRAAIARINHHWQHRGKQGQT
jgi:hypothetical protein